MILLSEQQIERIYDVTDRLGLNRGWVVVPMMAADPPQEMTLPDGKVLICAPGARSFDEWLAGLADRLKTIDLSRAPRAEKHDPPLLNTPSHPEWGSTSRRYIEREPERHERGGDPAAPFDR